MKLNFKNWMEVHVHKPFQFNNWMETLEYLQERHGKIFVQFSDIEKLGINPKSEYNTPIGIYAYPSDYVLEHKGEVPFASGRKNLIVFKPKSIKIITLDKITEIGDYYIQYRDKIIDIFGEESVKKAEEMVEGDDYQIRSNGSLLWLITKILSKGPKDWRSIFIKLNIDGFIDNETGTIHSNETTQAVFFNTLDLQLIDIIKKESDKDTKKAERLTFPIINTLYEEKIKFLNDYLAPFDRHHKVFFKKDLKRIFDNFMIFINDINFLYPSRHQRGTQPKYDLINAIKTNLVAYQNFLNSNSDEFKNNNYFIYLWKILTLFGKEFKKIYRQYEKVAIKNLYYGNEDIPFYIDINQYKNMFYKFYNSINMINNDFDEYDPKNY